MHLYLLNVKIKETRNDFRLVIDADGPSSLEGDWHTSSPGDFYMSALDGFWFPFRRGRRELVFLLYPGSIDKYGAFFDPVFAQPRALFAPRHRDLDTEESRVMYLLLAV